MERPKRAAHKLCFVPGCKSATKTTPEKIFIRVPDNPEKRQRWRSVVGRNGNIIDKTSLYCCEDHFNLKEDAENYLYFKTINNVRLRLKADVVPHIFTNQAKEQPDPLDIKSGDEDTLCFREMEFVDLNNYLEIDSSAHGRQSNIAHGRQSNIAPRRSRCKSDNSAALPDMASTSRIGRINKDLLIKEVKARPALWNSDDVSFRKRETTMALWEEIAILCDTHVSVIKIKWKSLKDQFRRELQRSSVTKWRYFEPMQFTKQELMASAEENASTDWENEEEPAVVRPSFVSPNPSCASFEEPKRSWEDDKPEHESTEVWDTADQNFFKSLQPFMREFSPLERLRLHSKIQGLILEELIKKEANAGKKSQEAACNFENCVVKEELLCD